MAPTPPWEWPATPMLSTSTLVAQNGFGALTYDALARATGMTKGGILYHFPTKEALVRGVFEDVLATRTARLDHNLGSDPGSASKVDRLVAYVRSTAGEAPQPEELSLFVDAMRVEDLRRLWRDSGLDALEGREFDTAGVDAQLMRFAADGLWMLESLGVVSLDDPQREALVVRATDLIRSSERSAPSGTSTSPQA